MPTNDHLRAQLVDLLREGNAHMSFAEAVADFPEAMINARPRNVDYSFWQLLEHMRMTQRDILEYLTNPAYKEGEWPRDYWPAPYARATRQEWDASVAAFTNDRDCLIAIASDEATDLLAIVPSHAEHTTLRELLVVADHNAYHIGELAILRQTESAWGPGHDPDAQV